MTKFDFNNIPFDDEKTWRLISSGRTKGCFQIESQLCQEWCKKVQPKSISELSDVIALVRPGPLESGQSETYANRRNGKESVDFLIGELEPILKETQGIILFQEQALEIASRVAGFDLITSDTLRRGIGKKMPEVIAQLKPKFIQGCVDNGVDQEKAEKIFSWIETAQRYSFNKSHSISYALLSYQTAYVKAHYPTEFYCSWLNCSDQSPSPKEEVYELCQDAKLRDIEIVQPDIKRGNTNFTIVGDKKISFGLSHIRDVGKSSVKAINSLKNKIETFKDLLLKTKKIKKNVCEALIKSGACDCYGLQRTYMLKCVQMVGGQKHCEDAEYKPLTQKELEGFLLYLKDNSIKESLEKVIENKYCVKKRAAVIQKKIDLLDQEYQDTNRQKAIWEKIYLGLPVTCSIADDLDHITNAAISCKEAFYTSPGDIITLHVVVEGSRERKTKKTQKKYCYLSVSDNSCGLDNLVCWPNNYGRIGELFKQDRIVELFGRKDSWRGREQIIVEDAVPVD